ncbi:hypothetical protein KKE60_08360 [Patescibacteria group bacterium]|nr:hypothetical protein [Patescibacteria group bacterium]
MIKDDFANDPTHKRLCKYLLKIFPWEIDFLFNANLNNSSTFPTKFPGRKMINIEKAKKLALQKNKILNNN